MSKKSNDWERTQSLSDEEIEKASRDLLSNPSCSLKGGERIDNVFYSYSQMLKMFRKGMRSMFEYFYENDTGRVKSENSAYSRIRDMEVGDEIGFPYEKWSATRSACCKLKESYGCKFSVHRVRNTLDLENEIRVTRLE